jgi:hypothetical protein
MKFLKDPKKILRYFYDEAIGRFLGFIIAMSASGLVSKFFETRSFRNLWGITAKKKVISKESFENYEWIASVVIGFIVLELYNTYLKESIEKYAAIGFRKTREMINANLIEVPFYKEKVKPFLWAAKRKSGEVRSTVSSTFGVKYHVFILQMRKLIAQQGK